MFLHNTKLMYTVRVDEPDPEFAKLLLEQFGGPNGELAAAMRYFLQGWNEPNGARRSMLLDIATEELSHLEMVAQTLTLLLKGSPSELVDQVEGTYLGELLDGNMPAAATLALNSGANVLGGGGARLTDSQGAPFTAAFIDTLGEPAADLRSDIAAEARAKIVYERLIKLTDDNGAKDTLTFLMTREIAHQKSSKPPSLRWIPVSHPAPCPATRNSATPTSPIPETSAHQTQTTKETPRDSTSPRPTPPGASPSTINPPNTPPTKKSSDLASNHPRPVPGPAAPCGTSYPGPTSHADTLIRAAATARIALTIT